MLFRSQLRSSQGRERGEGGNAVMDVEEREKGSVRAKYAPDERQKRQRDTSERRESESEECSELTTSSTAS